VGPHAGEEEHRIATAVAELLGATPAPSGRHRREAVDEGLTSRTLTVLVRGRHRIMVDAMLARHLRAAGGPVLVVGPAAGSPTPVTRGDRWFLPVL
jgi:hypothetical protein